MLTMFRYPNECICQTGYVGVQCESCHTYPGCVHGFCTNPWECICKEVRSEIVYCLISKRDFKAAIQADLFTAYLRLKSPELDTQPLPLKY
jgi:hypothetical protein